MLLVIRLPQVGLYFCPLTLACILTVQVSAWHVSINKRLLNDWNKVCKNQHICFYLSFAALGPDSGALDMLGKQSTVRLHSQTSSFYRIAYIHLTAFLKIWMPQWRV